MKNMAEVKDDMLLSGWEIHAVQRNGWIIFVKEVHKPSRIYDQVCRFCTLFHNGRVARYAIRPRTVARRKYVG
jgi:hypothetical protein